MQLGRAQPARGARVLPSGNRAVVTGLCSFLSHFFDIQLSGEVGGGGGGGERWGGARSGAERDRGVGGTLP